MGCEMRERSAVKVARFVLRGLEVGNDLRLLDRQTYECKILNDAEKRETHRRLMR